MTKITDPQLISGFWRGVTLLGLSLAMSLLLILSPGIGNPPTGALLLSGDMIADLPGEASIRVHVPTLYSAGKDSGFRPGIYAFEFGLSVPVSSNTSDLVIVFPHISGSSLSVSFNGSFLGSRGDPVSGRSTIWNSAHVFQVPQKDIRGSSVVRAAINGIYEGGIIARPYLVEAGRHGWRLFFLMLLSNYSIWISFGALIAVSLIVLSMGFYEKGGPSAGLYLGIAGILVAIFITDFAFLERLPISLAVFKRLVVSCRHIASLLFILAYFRLLGRKPGAAGIGICILQAACAILVLAFPGDIIDIKRLYGYTYLSFVPFLAYLLFIILKYTRKFHAFDLLTFGALVALICSLRDIIHLILLPDSGANMVSHYGFVVLALSTGAYIVQDAFLHYNALATEKQRAAFFRNESRMDELTGCYNRKAIPALESSLGKVFSLLVFDVDNLKAVNDTHGHLAGDAILIDAARIATREVRASDLVLRIGGDEFMVVLKECPEATARSVAERIVRDCAASVVNAESGEAITYTISLGVATCAAENSSGGASLQRTMESADARLYKAKKAGKGRWCAG